MAVVELGWWLEAVDHLKVYDRVFPLAEVFQWVIANGEGVPANEPIYKDEWLRDETVSEELSSSQNDSTDDKVERSSSSTALHFAVDGEEVVTLETTLGMSLPARKVNIDSWFDGLSSG